eukprot:Gb_39003 [translate_table: standard]
MEQKTNAICQILTLVERGSNPRLNPHDSAFKFPPSWSQTDTSDESWTPSSHAENIEVLSAACRSKTRLPEGSRQAKAGEHKTRVVSRRSCIEVCASSLLRGSIQEEYSASFDFCITAKLWLSVILDFTIFNAANGPEFFAWLNLRNSLQV